MAFVLKRRNQGKQPAATTTRPGRTSVSRHCAVAYKTGTERQALPPRVAAPVIQAKLKVGESNDRFEQEADRVADTVMRMPDDAVEPAPVNRDCIANPSGALAARGHSGPKGSTIQRQEQMDPVSQNDASIGIQRACSDCEEELRMQPAKEKPHPSQTVDKPARVGTELESRIGGLRTGGEPLPTPLRTFFEPRFNYDFSSVRLHTGAEAARGARDLGARAFTVGADIVFGRGEYAPDIAAGRNLIAHELTHVVQQSAAPKHTGNVQFKEPQSIRRQVIDPSCTGRENKIREGFENARRMASDTVSQLERARDLRDEGVAVSAVNPGVAAAIQNAFGKFSELDVGAHSLGQVARSRSASLGSGQLDKLLERYRKLAAGLENENLKPRCDVTEGLQKGGLSEDACDGLLGAFVLLDDAHRNDIFLCPKFFEPDSTPQRRGLFLIHELAHSVLRIGHEGGKILQIGCGAIGLSFNDAIRNAYAYELLAECFHSEEVETAKGEELEAGPGKSVAGGKAVGRGVRLELGVDVSPFEARVLRRFASLTLEVPIKKNDLGIFSPSIGFKVLSLPGSTVNEDHVVAAMVDLGARLQQPIKGFYLDIEGGVLGGARFEPGKETTRTIEFGATLGVGYRFKNFEFGAEASAIDPTGDNSRVYIVGRAALRL